MSVNLIEKGHDVLLFDSDPNTVRRLKNERLPIAETLDRLIEFSDCFVSMLPNGKAVLDLYGGPNGIAEKMRRGALVIDCSTVDPGDALKLKPILDRRGALYVDAPVSGGVNAAAKGSLTFMVGGEKEAFERAEVILRSMGANVIHCGKQGNGQVAKICNNMLLAVSMIGVSEALNLGKTMGLDPKLLLKIINISSGRCWSSEVYSPAPGTMDGVPSSASYRPGFQSKIMLKDLRIARDSAVGHGVETPLGLNAFSIYDDLCRTDMADLDFSVVYKYLDSTKSSK